MADGANKAGGRPLHYTPVERLACALAYAVHKFSNMTLWVALERVWGEHCDTECPPHAYKACARWYKRLMEEGGVHDAPRGAPLHKVPDAVAARAAALVKEGYLVRVTRGAGAGPNRTHEERRFYHSIHEAVSRVPELHGMLTTYDVSMEHLLRRMHEVDPDLKWGRLDTKHRLKEETMAQRVNYCTTLLEHLEGDPMFLNKVLFLDETKVWGFDGSAMDVHVWYDAHCAEARTVLPCVSTAGAKPMHVCLYAAVSGDVGLVGFQYTSGTTDFPAKWPQEPLARAAGAAERQDPNYKVGGEGRNTMLLYLSSSGVHE